MHFRFSPFSFGRRRHHNRHQPVGNRETVDPRTLKGKLFSLLFLALGLGLIIGSYYKYQSTQEFLATAVDATGQVTQVRSKTDSDGDIRYYPEISFQTSTGQSHRFVGSSGTSFSKYRKGDSVDVLYAPEEPSNAAIKGSQSPVLTSVLMIGAGILFGFFGVMGLKEGLGWKSKKKRLMEHGRDVEAIIVGPEAALARMPAFMRNKVSGEMDNKAWQLGKSVMAEWNDPQTGEDHLFIEHSWQGEKPPVGSPIRVKVDPKNPKNYIFVDADVAV